MDRSALVRLVLASTLQRLPVNQRIELAAALLSRSEDDADHNLPSLIWTGLIPVADSDPDSLVRLALDCRLPNVLRLIARRLGEEIETRPGPLNALLERGSLPPGRLPGSRGSPAWPMPSPAGARRRSPRPGMHFKKSSTASSDPALRARARDLNVLFGDGRALAEVKRLAFDDSASLEVRKAALATLIDSRPPDLRSVCERLVRVRFLNVVAVRGLALSSDPAIGKKLAESYRAFHPSERSVLLETLTSRPAFARALLDQIAAGKIPRQELTAFHVRQIRSLGDRALTERLAQVWGVLRDSDTDRRERIAAFKKQLTGPALARADLSHGRAVFDRVCASCHKLYGSGGEVGPDLTGTGRDNLDYLLENLIDPGASVSADFRMVVVAMNDGRVLNGLVRARTDRTLTLQTQTETLVLDRREIDSEKVSSQSLMPDGLLAPLSESDTRDLLAYLMSPTPVRLPVPER